MNYWRTSKPHYLVFLTLGTVIPLSTVWSEEPAKLSYTQEELVQKISALRKQESHQYGQEAVISLFFDERHVADLIARIRGDGSLPAFRYRDIRKFLGESLNQEVVLALGEQQDIHGWVSVKYLEQYTPDYREDSQSLHLVPPADERQGGEINLQPRFPIDMSKALYPEEVSGYVNLFNQLSGEDGSVTYSLISEGAFRCHPWVLEGRMDFTPFSETVFDYDNLRLVRDYPERLTRLTIGETQSFHPRILTSDRIQGIKISTEYDLQPQVITSPISEFSFLLQRDSTVEVWVNGQEVEKLRLKAGPYDLLNFPLRIGLNEVTLRIYDDLGREQSLYFETVKGPNLLEPGLKEYTGSIGVKGGGKDYSGDFTVGGFYRRGMTDQVTASVEIRGDPGHLGVGSALDFAFPWFFGVLEAGISHSTVGTGGAVQLSLSRYFDSVVLTYRMDCHQRNFLNQNQLISTNRIKLFQEVSVNLPNFRGMGSLHFRATNVHRWNGPRERLEELRWTRNLNNRWSFLLKGTHDHGAARPWSIGGQLTYNYYSDSYRHRHDLQVEREQWNLRSMVGGNPTKPFGDWQVTHHEELIQGKSDSLSGTFRYRHNRFTALYRGDIGDFGDDNNITQTLNLHTALAYANGSWALGQTITNSFAIIDSHPGLGEVEMEALTSGITSHGTTKMGALVPNLSAYEAHVLTVEASRSETVLEPYPFLLFPHYKSGFRFEIDNQDGDGGVTRASGVLLDHFSRPVPFTTLFVTNTSKEDSEPFITFTNNSGTFFLDAIHPGQEYVIQLGEDGQMLDGKSVPKYEVALPEETKSGETVDLGKILPSNIPLEESPWKGLPIPEIEKPQAEEQPKLEEPKEPSPDLAWEPDAVLSSPFATQPVGDEGDGGIAIATGVLLDEYWYPITEMALVVENKSLPDQKPFMTFANKQGCFCLSWINPGHQYVLHSLNSYQELSYEIIVPETASIGQEVILGRIKPVGDPDKKDFSPHQAPLASFLVESKSILNKKKLL